MKKKKPKFYVVWQGHRVGVYETWVECKKQIDGFPGAVYKSFSTRTEAQNAFNGNSYDYIGKDVFAKPELSPDEIAKYGEPIKNSITVDGACSGKTGLSEYQAVHTAESTPIFHQGPFEDGTNNIMEFLALVHALAYCKQHKLDLPIYSDSKIAMSWVARKTQRTNHPRSAKNVKIFELLDRAEKWLNENQYSNPILKWETKAWGENPADFGRK
jgi:ribonuclease HI